MNRILYILSICVAVIAATPVCSRATEGPSAAPLNVYTHGFGPFAFLRKDGAIEGPGVDVLSCALGAMGLKYQLNVVPLARARRLFGNETLDLWFPTYHWSGRDNEQYIIGELGRRELSWYIRPDAKINPDNSDFKANALIGTFAKSGPETMLRERGYQLGKTSDNGNQLLLWLLEGKVDALLTLNFRNLLSPRLKQRFDELQKTYYETFRMGFEVAQHFDEKHPTFRPAFKKHLKACDLTTK